MAEKDWREIHLFYTFSHCLSLSCIREYTPNASLWGYLMKEDPWKISHHTGWIEKNPGPWASPAPGAEGLAGLDTARDKHVHMLVKCAQGNLRVCEPSKQDLGSFNTLVANCFLGTE